MKIIKGNLIDLAEAGHFDVIIQGCNCFNTMGSGLAKEIRERYPEAYEIDKKTVKGDQAKLGTYTKYDTGKFHIVNAYTQFGKNKAGETKMLFEYEAFKEILLKLENDFPHHTRFGFPLIGCGLAYADKYTVLKMLVKFDEEVCKNQQTVTLVEF